MNRGSIVKASTVALLALLAAAAGGKSNLAQCAPADSAAAGSARDSGVVAPQTQAPETSHTTPAAMARALVLGAAYQSTDSLIAARARIEALAADAPRSAALQYWLALADYRLAPRLMKDPAAAARWVKDGLARVALSRKLAPKSADALALEAGLDGVAIMLAPDRAIELSATIEELLGKATAFGPRNPRVVLFDAINTYHMPAFVGGGPDRAIPKLDKALELFAAEKPEGPAAIDWGNDDAYAWLGRAQAATGKRDRARESYQRALALNPGNAWVEHVLIPELDPTGTKDKP